MTHEQQEQIKSMLENLDKHYLLTLLVTQLEQNHMYDFEKVSVTINEFLGEVKKVEENPRYK